MAADKAAGECGGSRLGPRCPPGAWAAGCGGIRSRAGGGECRYIPGGRRKSGLSCSVLFPSAEEVVSAGLRAAGVAGVRCRRGPPPVGLRPGGSAAGLCGARAFRAVGEGGLSRRSRLAWKGSVGRELGACCRGWVSPGAS